LKRKKNFLFSKIIEDIRKEIKVDNAENLKSKIETLKTAMKDMVAVKMNDDANSDPMSNLNDL
jgi:hypothetical protein